MTSYEATIRTFPEPEPGKAGIYIYRDSNLGFLYDKAVFINGTCVGKTSAHSFLYMQLPGDRDYVFSAASEFSPNSLKLHLDNGHNYFINHYLKIGLVIPGANLEHITDLNVAKTGVLNGRLITSNKCYGAKFDYVQDYPEMSNAPQVNFVLNPVKTTVVLPDGTESTPPKFLANWQTVEEKEPIPTSNHAVSGTNLKTQDTLSSEVADAAQVQNENNSQDIASLPNTSAKP